jgi:hypothetical protein
VTLDGLFIDFAIEPEDRDQVVAFGVGNLVSQVFGVPVVGATIAYGGDGDFNEFDPAAYSGSILSSGAVPEPATWAMMIGGMGMVGGAMRRRRVSTKVTFA